MKLRPYPKIGDTRTVTRFAVLPVTLTDGARIWLEEYRELMEWREYIGCDGFWRTAALYQGQPPPMPKLPRFPPKYRREVW